MLAFVIKPYPGGPSVPSHLQIRLWFIKVSQPTTPKITIPTSRPEQQQQENPHLLALYHRVCQSFTLHIQLTLSPLIHHLYLPCSVFLFAHRLPRDPSSPSEIQTSRERLAIQIQTHSTTHTNPQVPWPQQQVTLRPSFSSTICIPISIYTGRTVASRPLLCPRLPFVVRDADCVDSQRRFRASQPRGVRVKDQQHQRAASLLSQTMSTTAAQTQTISNSPPSGSRNSSSSNSSNNKTASSGRSPLHHGQHLPNMFSPPALFRSSPLVTTR